MSLPDQSDINRDAEIQIWDDGLCRSGKTGARKSAETKLVQRSFAMKGIGKPLVTKAQISEIEKISNNGGILNTLPPEKCKESSGKEGTSNTCYKRIEIAASTTYPNKFGSYSTFASCVTNNLTTQVESRKVSVNQIAENKSLEKPFSSIFKPFFGSKLNMQPVSCTNTERKTLCDINNSNTVTTDLLKVLPTQQNVKSNDMYCSMSVDKDEESRVKDVERLHDVEAITNNYSKKAQKSYNSRNTSFPIEASNYRKLNMKVKRYSKNGRSKRVLYMRQRKKRQLIAKFKACACFRCGEEGHWAKNCTKSANSRPISFSASNATKDLFSESSDTADLQNAGSGKLNVKHSSPVFQHDDNLHLMTAELEKGLHHLKFKIFREGQKEVVTRIMQGKSTLAVLPTGSGKSLCYQLPAYLYSQREKSIALIISPLVALMNDQVLCLPRGVKGACLHNQMTAKERDKVMTDVEAGRLCLLLVSPETIMSCNLADPSCLLYRLPAISFVCIDEVHCIFAWSHNFRPSYLRLCSFLKDECGVKCFLGLTATATVSVSKEIAKLLGISEHENGIVCVPYKGSGVNLSVSKTKHKDDDLLALLRGSRFASCPSIIVYCTRRQEAEHVATLVRTCLQQEQVGNLPGWQTAVCYHAGMTAEQRKRVQKAFMSSKIRLVAATVAFGMGLNKKDLRGVIHYCMPSSAESYVQEIGRAGRDGGGADCHLFVESNSFTELQRHIVAHTVDASVIKKFVKDVFKSCHCQQLLGKCNQLGEADTSDMMDATSDVLCRGHERAIGIDSLVHALDMPEDSISTLFCYLELHPMQYVRYMRPTYATCRIDCYGGPSQLEEISRTCPAVGIGLLMAKKNGLWHEGDSSLQMAIIDVSDYLGEEASTVRAQLSRLCWSIDKKPTGVKVSYSDLSFHYHVRSRTDIERDDITSYLVNEVTKLESRALGELRELHKFFVSVESTNVNECVDSVDERQSTAIHETLLTFSSRQLLFDVVGDEVGLNLSAAQSAQSDIYNFINIYQADHELTGRIIARIFHGISSPNYPACVWGKVRRFWRCHLDIDFNELRVFASLVLQQLKRKAQNLR